MKTRSDENKKSCSSRKILTKILIRSLVTLAILYTLIPVLSLILISISKQGMLPEYLFDISLKNFSLSVWAEFFKSGKLLFPMLNSIIIATVVTIITIIVSFPASYSFSRWKSNKRRPLLLVILVFRMIPTIAIIIPFFLIVARLGLIDNIWGVILCLIPIQIPFAIWLMKGYVDGTPRELEEAAWVEGASIPRTIINIIIPLCMPGILVTSILVFLSSYVEYMVAATVVRNNAITLPVKIAGYFTPHSVYYQNIAVATLLGILPMIILYSLIRKHLTAGVAIGSSFK